MRENLQNKVVLITGASRGIGRACSGSFSNAGCKVAIHYNVNKSEAEKVQSLMEGESFIFQADLSNADGCRKLLEDVKSEFGALDILVANHGVWEYAGIDKISSEELDRTIDINLKSLFYLTREAVPLFPEKGASIVFISSTAGQRGEAEYSHYAASKGGMIALTKSLAVELAPLKIRVNAVAPGWVLTDMTKDILVGDYLKTVEESIPLKKVALPEDIAPAVVFLASGYANHITGEILNINGGSVLCG